MDKFIPAIVDSGFDGVLIDNGSCINSWGIKDEIVEITNGTLHTSEDFRYIFIDISEYVNNFKE